MKRRKREEGKGREEEKRKGRWGKTGGKEEHIVSSKRGVSVCVHSNLGRDGCVISQLQ